MSQQRIPIKVVELLLLRLGLLSTAILCWNAATLVWEAGNPTHDTISIVLPLLCYITGFVLLILAVVKPHLYAIPVALIIVFCAYLQFDRIHSAQQNVFMSTDVY